MLTHKSRLQLLKMKDGIDQKAGSVFSSYVGERLRSGEQRENSSKKVKTHRKQSVFCLEGGCGFPPHPLLPGPGMRSNAKPACAALRRSRASTPLLTFLTALEARSVSDGRMEIRNCSRSAAFHPRTTDDKRRKN